MRSLATAIFLFFALLSITSVFGQRRISTNPLDTLGKNPSQSLGWEILQNSRAVMGSIGDYSYRFQLRIMPRRQETIYLSGVMIGSSNERGPVERIDIIEEDAKLGPEGELIDPKVHRLLLQNGPSPFAMQAFSYQDGPPELLTNTELFEPVVSSTFSSFELLRPFLYWQRFYYEGRTTLRRRPTHSFLMYPPDDDGEIRENVSGVRLLIDDQFRIVFKGQILGPDEEPIKTISIAGLKKVDGEWIFSSIDVRDEKTKDKTRLRIMDASVGVAILPDLFEPAGLVANIIGKRFRKETPADFKPVEPTAD